MDSKKYKLLCGLIFIFPLQDLYPQQGRTGFGASAGSSTYTGDLDHNFPIRFTRPGFGFHIVKGFVPRLEFRAAYYHGWLSASDGESASELKARSLSFRTNIDEVSATLKLKVLNQKNASRLTGRIEPYVFAGIAFFHFNPQAVYQGKYYDLQPLGTEGQYLQDGNHPKPYRLWQWAIPVGFGVERMITDRWRLGVETGFRKLFTDYLDDVSGRYPEQEQLLAESGPVAAALSDPSDRSVYPQGRYHYNRGDPSHMDWYVYTNFHLTYFISSSQNRYASGKSSAERYAFRCPGMR